MHRNSFIFLTFLVIQSTTAQSIDTVKVMSEIEEFYAGYVSAYTSLQAEELADNFILAPIYFRNDNDTALLQSRGGIIDYLNSRFSELSDQNYVRSEILASNFCILSDASAIVSVGFRRFDSADNVIYESGATYSIIKIEDHWRFAMISSHSAENVVSCSNYD